MALHFVKTAVLSSEDGIDFSKETNIESAEAQQTRLLAERANAKPLHQQLAEQKERKQEQYDANTKLLFAPPKGLDEEEFSFLQNLQDHQTQKVNQQKQAETEALEAFRLARQIKELDDKPVVKPVVVGIQSSSSNSTANKPILPVITAKRKRIADSDEHHTKTSKVASLSTVEKEKKEEKTSKQVEPPSNAVNELSLLCDYGSDED